ncbi:hypothetical protein FOS14_01220 [Skermania sp. ID1734]|uniref:type VII secretion target n=1 Tax=Skermania sp. ID1734 TaxID=2597516 RepID=UPI00117D3854|nr:type VII secretion target [Skermania sp. ID1734]TSE02038.1 hypothetical protein FOS14_01220 [Skermania sp. ID1734]
MSELWVHTPGLAEYSAAASRLGVELTAAGNSAAAADVGLLGPVFGLIGQDFVAAFASAHAAHIQSLQRLAVVQESLSAAADAATAEYLHTDASNADHVGGVWA